MYPFIIHFNDFYFPTFFFMIMVASLATTFYIYWKAPRVGLSQIVVLDLALIGTIFGIIGARLFHVFVEAPHYYWVKPIRVLHVWQGGFVGYGAFIGVTLSILIYLKIKKLPILAYCDLVALGCPLIILFIRVGCLGAGCCYGKPTTFPIHLIFNNPSSDAGSRFPGVPLHATQIYDMLNALFTFGLVNWLYQRRKFDGQVMIVFFMSYGIIRFFIEFLRGDADRGLYFNDMISTSQIVGLVIVVFGSLAYYLLSRKSKHLTKHE